MIYRKQFMGNSPIKRVGKKITKHRDCTISFFNIQTQCWERIEADKVPEEVIATFSAEDKNRLEGMIISLYSPFKPNQ
jgi:hypothetical protein